MEDLSQKHRLASITDIQNSHKKEVETQTKVLLKYQTTYNIANCISVTAGSLEGGNSIVTLSSKANPLITIPSASVSAILGSVAFVIGVWNRILLNKVTCKKYGEYLSTAQAKLNSIQKTLSRSLDDSKITAEERLTCITQYESYQKLQQEVRKKFKTSQTKSARSPSVLPSVKSKPK